MRLWYCYVLVLLALILGSQKSFGQCTNCDVQYPAGTSSTTSNSLVEAVVCAWGGEYSIYNVTAGETYTWTTCGGGAWDTQLTLFSGTSCGTGFLAYNDDDCGFQSTITWTASFTGQVNLLITQYNCQWNSSCMTINWACTTCGGGGGSGDINACSGNWYDPGGAGGNYPPNQNDVTTICPDTPGDCIQLNFSAFNIESGWDYLTVYNGSSTAAPVIGVYTGTQLTGNTVQSTDVSGCLTFLFESDGSFQYSGWSATISCFDCDDPPPASQQDCNGAETICSDQTFDGNSSGPGTQELNGTNSGCLSIENESSWFFFSPQSTGTIAFMITPTPIVDYDFAIWGPYDDPICPPPGAPLRCSWSAAYAPTGLQAGAGDNSEGAGGDAVVNPITVGPADVGKVYILYIDNWTASTTPFTLSWNLGGGLSLDCTVLPVEMLDFSGKRENGENVLEWQTASESNTDYFSIERSNDARNFETIGNVPATGNSNTITEYRYSDPYSSQNAYYRLKQVDFDGKHEYYGPISILDDQWGVVVSDPFPNPTTDAWINLNVSTPSSMEMTVSIQDLTGRILKTEKYALERGSKLLRIDLSEYASGAYHLKVTDNQQNVLHSSRIVH